MSDPRETILEQVGYLADELEAQRAVLALIPDPLRTADTPGSPSITRLYGLLLARETEVHAPVCWYLAGREDEEPVIPTDQALLERVDAEAEIESVIDQIRDHRSMLVEILGATADTHWTHRRPLRGADVTLADYAYQMTQADVDILRRITELLYEGQMGAPRVRSL